MYNTVWRQQHQRLGGRGALAASAPGIASAYMTMAVVRLPEMAIRGRRGEPALSAIYNLLARRGCRYQRRAASGITRMARTAVSASREHE